MHVVFDTEKINLDDFIQHGAGNNYFEGMQPYQRGWGVYTYHRQRGKGLGNILKSLYRLLLPLAKKTGSTIGKEGMSTAARILTKLSEGQNFKDTVKDEAKVGVHNLVEKLNTSNQTQQGTGFRRTRKVLKKAIIPTIIKKRKRSDAFGLY